jgi:hypothetical protein
LAPLAARHTILHISGKIDAPRAGTIRFAQATLNPLALRHTATSPLNRPVDRLGPEVTLRFKGIMRPTEHRDILDGRLTTPGECVLMVKLETTTLGTSAPIVVHECALLFVPCCDCPLHAMRNVTTAALSWTLFPLRAFSLGPPLLLELHDERVQSFLENSLKALITGTHQFLRPDELLPQFGARRKLNLEPLLAERRDCWLV